MKYFIDTEFIEGYQKPIKWLPAISNFNKPYHSIQLVSIALVAEDGSVYYAISKDFDPYTANDFVHDNVFPAIVTEYENSLQGVRLQLARERFQKCKNYAEAVALVQKWIGKTNKDIAREIWQFINPDLGFHVSGYSNSELRPGGKLYDHFQKHGVVVIDDVCVAKPEFYGYYCDYDWVVFCSLFGSMAELPRGFPMYCRDLKQMQDEANYAPMKEFTDMVAEHLVDEVPVSVHPLYPQNPTEHHALADAKWNKQLYDFLTQTIPMAKKQNNLIELAQKLGTDKLEHGYLPHYSKHLPLNVNRLLEIGAFKGASLRMWQSVYGPKAEIHTIDLFSEHLTPEQCFTEGFVPHKGSQSDISFLYTIKEMFEVIIDDGSHNSIDQAISFKHLFVNNLCAGGIYVIEDLHCCNEEFYRQNGNLEFKDTMLAELKLYAKTKTFAGKMFGEDETATFKKLIDKVWVYDDKIAFIQKKR